MKKNILAVLSIATIMSASMGLTSCGNKSNAVFEIPEGGFDFETPVEIKFYSSQGEALKKVTDAAIAEFQNLYPNITVDHQKIGDYDDVRDQTTTELSVNAGPDMVYCYPDHIALYNKKKAVVTLDNLINDTTTDEEGNLLYGLSQAQQDDFIKGFWNEGKQFGDGLMYSLPFSKSTEVMYYNIDFFAENNLTVPTHWFSTGADDTSSVEYVSKKIQEIDPDATPFGYDSASNWFITLTEQYGSDYTSATGDHFLFDNATNREFVTKLGEWYKEGYYTTHEINKAYTSALFTNIPTAENPVRCYFCIGSSAGAFNQVPAKIDINVPKVDKDGNPVLDKDGKPVMETKQDYPFQVGIAPIPQVDPTNPKVISQGPSICLLNQGDPQKVMASWLLLRYLTTNVAFQGQFSMSSGYVPVIKSVNENDTYAKFLAGATDTSKDQSTRIKALSAKTCLEQQNAYYSSPAFYGSSVAREEVGFLLEAVATGSKTVDKAFADALSQCEYKSN